MPTLKTVTLGCKVNQYETQYLREGLLRLGYRDAAAGEPADLCVVNTCTVTREGDYKSRKIIRALARQNPGSQILVMGCYATRAADQLAVLPGVVEVLTDKRQLPDLLARLGLVDVPTGISSFRWRHRAWVKVQDGCRMGCAYCIVPKVRPSLWSRPPNEVLEEVRRLVDAGYREIVLTGIHLGHYGLDASRSAESLFQNGDVAQPSWLFGDVAQPSWLFGDRLEACATRFGLTSLVQRIVALEGDFRLRLSSLEAAEATADLIGLMADHPHRICPHLHLPLQSGSDQVLAAMRRGDRSRQFVDTCLAVRQRLHNVAVTTDVIVGFPGETEADFQATCRVAEEVGFAKIHVFRYSPREGTLAAEMPGQVPDAVKQRRAAELGRISRRLQRQYLNRLVGRPLQVLVESPVAGRPGTFLGTSGNYATVELPGADDDEGRIVWTTGREVVGDRVRAAGENGFEGEGPSQASPGREPWGPETRRLTPPARRFR